MTILGHLISVSVGTGWYCGAIIYLSKGYRWPMFYAWIGCVIFGTLVLCGLDKLAS